MAHFEVLEAYLTLRREVALIWSRASKDLDFGHNQIRFLFRLNRSNATMGELAEDACTDKSSASRTISLLEKEGLVKRIGDKDDRRIVHIELTAKGRKQAKKANDIRNRIAKQLDDCLTAAERKTFALLISKIANP